jgi:regulator of RNase E activity RraA
MNTPLTPGQLESLRRLDTCTVANAIETFHIRLRNEGFAAGCLRCRFPQLQTMVGHAVTLKIRGSSPPIGGAATYLESTDWWDYILSVPAPRVVVVQDVGAVPGRGALLGEVHINLLRALGCVGAVTNGAVRDLSAVGELGFHLFSCNLSVSHSYVHIVETGTPVQIDGMTIRSGDLLHGDQHGIQSIPHEIAADLPAAVATITARERALIAQIRAPGVALEQLRAAVRGLQSA